ncbi:MAG: oligoendopeptidase F [Deltaproteobacteria bacterium]|nr:oligoendopeptidase F [Deltaproteobacteria bacterium]
MVKKTQIITRDQVPVEDTWNLTRIFKSRAAWRRAFTKLEEQFLQYADFKKRMTQSAEELAALLEFDVNIEKQLERIGSYAFLNQSTDLASTENQELVSVYSNLATRIQEASSYITPQILAIPPKKMSAYLEAECLKDFVITLKKIIRQKKHVLSQKEERILAMQGEIVGSAGDIFRKLNDTDFKFGHVKVDGQSMELSQSTYSLLLESPKRSVRKSAFTQLFGKYGEFGNTLAETYNASVLQDVYQSKVRNFSSSLERSLFVDDVPVSVYDNLISTVHDHLHINHRFLALLKKTLKLRDLHFYDTYVPLVSSINWKMPYDDAVELICEALQPLGAPYCKVLKKGLTKDRWVDRYENKGKRSGAFSAGGYEVAPYILMNYKPDSLQSVYTLAHEAGHSMHTWFSAKNQHFSNYDYTIFVAEVASTFNEQLLTEHLLQTAKDKRMKAYIVDREINQIRATLIRQTMFAEFEKISHDIVESGEALTLERLKNEYTALVRAYFGPDFAFDDQLAMEWARIPHFYSAFYVYKYATGLTAATALSQKVLHGNKSDRDAYLNFLKSGASAFPLELLKKAGADLSTPAPVIAMMQRFETLVQQLEELL